MKSLIRNGFVALLLFSLILVAGYQVAGAGILTQAAAGDVLQGPQNAANPANDKPGTVKPPPDAITITKSGTYNVGGFCNYTVAFVEPNPGISVRVALERPLPRSLPDGVHKVRQGCRVTYYQGGQRIDEFTDAMGTSQICFAPTPGKEMTIYYYNVYDASPQWRPVAATTVVNGLVCSPADPSAVYVATLKPP